MFRLEKEELWQVVLVSLVNYHHLTKVKMGLSAFSWPLQNCSL